MRFKDNSDGSFCIYLPMKNGGKFRWKKRTSSNEYGHSFATSSEPYSSDAYIEWQIGYDFPVTNKKGLTTILNERTFIGANKKKKRAYELSEIIYHMLEMKLLTEHELDELIKAIQESNFFLDEKYPITLETKDKLNIGGIEFIEETISLPTFVYMKKEGEPVIEVSIQKQQHATGTQPMVFFSIPIRCLENGQSYEGRSYKDLNANEKEGEYKIDEASSHYFTTLFKIFGICSKNHRHDVDEILELIKHYQA